MSNYFSNYSSPNIVIVPTISFCDKTPAKDPVQSDIINATDCDETSNAPQKSAENLKMLEPTSNVNSQSVSDSDEDAITTDVCSVIETCIMYCEANEAISNGVCIKNAISADKAKKTPTSWASNYLQSIGQFYPERSNLNLYLTKNEIGQKSKTRTDNTRAVKSFQDSLNDFPFQNAGSSRSPKMSNFKPRMDTKTWFMQTSNIKSEQFGTVVDKFDKLLQLKATHPHTSTKPHKLDTKINNISSSTIGSNVVKKYREKNKTIDKETHEKNTVVDPTHIKNHRKSNQDTTKLRKVNPTKKYITKKSTDSDGRTKKNRISSSEISHPVKSSSRKQVSTNPRLKIPSVIREIKKEKSNIPKTDTNKVLSICSKISRKHTNVSEQPAKKRVKRDFNDKQNCSNRVSALSSERLEVRNLNDTLKNEYSHANESTKQADDAGVQYNFNDQNKAYSACKRKLSITVSPPSKRSRTIESTKSSACKSDKVSHNSSTVEDVNGKHPRIQAPDTNVSSDDVNSNYDLRTKLSRQHYKRNPKKHESELTDHSDDTEYVFENLLITINQSNEIDINESPAPVPMKVKPERKKKCKKIKLVINVVCQDSDDSSDNSDNNTNIASNERKQCSLRNTDLSFLDDFNVDEIVNSLKYSPNHAPILLETKQPNKNFVDNKDLYDTINEMKSSTSKHEILIDGYQNKRKLSSENIKNNAVENIKSTSKNENDNKNLQILFVNECNKPNNPKNEIKSERSDNNTQEVISNKSIPSVIKTNITHDIINSFESDSTELHNQLQRQDQFETYDGQINSVINIENKNGNTVEDTTHPIATGLTPPDIYSRNEIESSRDITQAIVNEAKPTENTVFVDKSFSNYERTKGCDDINVGNQIISTEALINIDHAEITSDNETRDSKDDINNANKPCDVFDAIVQQIDEVVDNIESYIHKSKNNIKINTLNNETNSNNNNIVEPSKLNKNDIIEIIDDEIIDLTSNDEKSTSDSNCISDHKVINVDVAMPEKAIIEETNKNNDKDDSCSLETDVKVLQEIPEKRVEGDNTNTIASIENHKVTIEYVEDNIVNKDKTSSLNPTQNNLKSLSVTDNKIALKFEERIFSYLHIRMNVTSLIRSGRYSKIFKCSDSTKKSYAVKMLSHQYYKGLIIEKMMQELQKDLSVDKTHTVHVINGFGFERNWFLLMEYYPKNLKETLMEKRGPFHINRVQELTRQLVSAVLSLRNSNIVHSDIKPHHILVDASNKRLKLAGFDMAYYIQDKADDLVVPNIGTLQYRAPEIIVGYSASFSIDLWATATVIYEMATGEALFSGPFNNIILYQQMCFFGNLPEEMKRTRIATFHFMDECFMQRSGFRGLNVNFIQHFNKTNIMKTCLYKAYNEYWGFNKNNVQSYEDLSKMSSLYKLLDQMLVLDPRERLAIEFVYADPFIYENFM